jgi:hypothetical protein
VATTVATWILIRGGYHPVPGQTLDRYLRQRRRDLYQSLNTCPADPTAWSRLFADAVSAVFDFSSTKVVPDCGQKIRHQP